MSTHESRSIDEVIFDLSFTFGHNLHSFNQSGPMMDMIDGSRGLKDRIVAWAHEFDTAWWARPDDKREDYLTEIDEFADKKWLELLAELKRFDPATGITKPLAIVGVQVIPVHDALDEVIPQFSGPDADTTGWGIYFRQEDGTAKHVADVMCSDGYEIAMLMGRALAIEHLVQIEPQPWTMMTAPDDERFRVVWQIDVDAQSPREAALKAWELQKDQDSTATVFEVCDEDGNASVRIDLSVSA